MLELPSDYLNSSLAHFKNKISLEGRSRISKKAQVSYFVDKLRLWNYIFLTWKKRGKNISTYVTINVSTVHDKYGLKSQYFYLPHDLRQL